MFRGGHRDQASNPARLGELAQRLFLSSVFLARAILFISVEPRSIQRELHAPVVLSGLRRAHLDLTKQLQRRRDAVISVNGAVPVALECRQPVREAVGKLGAKLATGKPPSVISEHAV